MSSTFLSKSRVHKISKDGMTDLIRSISDNHESDHPFYLLDLATIERLINKWNHSFPNIKPFYAVKCNSHPSLLAKLAKLGANFDCASQSEIESVLNLGISPKQIIFANPCKAISHIKYAASVGVNMTTFDSKLEIDKIKKWHPHCQLLLRIKAPSDSGALRPLGKKFGALPEEAEQLLIYAYFLGMHVAGVSFHVGSIAQDPTIYRQAISAAKDVFDVANRLQMPRMHILDIGGGFRSTPLFEEIASVVKKAVGDYFSGETGLTIMAEPGRFFAETTFTLVTHVIGKRVRGDKREYWIDEGIYGSFRPTLYNSCFVGIKPLVLSVKDSEESCICESTIYGPSCDSLDSVAVGLKLPELQLEDLIVFYNMGAYSISAATKFNGFDMLATHTYLVNAGSS